MINALGGITVNINTYIPIGGNTDLGIPPKEYLKPGPNQHLKGREALWYARGRYGSDDFARMDRQRCVIDAIIKQANPANMLARYEEIAKAGKEIVKTDMPQEVLPLMVDLSPAGQGRQRPQRRVQARRRRLLQPQPRLHLMRKRVKTAIKETKKEKASSVAHRDHEGEEGEEVDLARVQRRRRRQGQRRHRRLLRLPALGRGDRSAAR